MEYENKMKLLKPPYIIRLEYSGIKISIEAETLEAVIDAYLAGSAVIEKMSELGHGQPKLFLTHLQKKGKDSSSSQ